MLSIIYKMHIFMLLNCFYTDYIVPGHNYCKPLQIPAFIETKLQFVKFIAILLQFRKIIVKLLQLTEIIAIYCSPEQFIAILL